MHIAINKLQTTFGSQVQPRILIVQMFPDDPTTYNSMMNCIFSAQKMNVLIDGLVLSNRYDSSILQVQQCSRNYVYITDVFRMLYPSRCIDMQYT